MSNGGNEVTLLKDVWNDVDKIEWAYKEHRCKSPGRCNFDCFHRMARMMSWPKRARNLWDRTKVKKIAKLSVLIREMRPDLGLTDSNKIAVMAVLGAAQEYGDYGI